MTVTNRSPLFFRFSDRWLRTRLTMSLPLSTSLQESSESKDKSNNGEPLKDISADPKLLSHPWVFHCLRSSFPFHGFPQGEEAGTRTFLKSSFADKSRCIMLPHIAISFGSLRRFSEDCRVGEDSRKVSIIKFINC